MNKYQKIDLNKFGNKKINYFYIKKNEKNNYSFIDVNNNHFC